MNPSDSKPSLSSITSTTDLIKTEKGSKRVHLDSLDSAVSVLGNTRRDELKRNISRCLPSLLLLLSVCASIASLAVMSVLWRKCDDLQTQLDNAHALYRQSQKDAGKLCLPCADIQQGPFEEENTELKELNIEDVNGTEICCAKTPLQTSHLLHLYAKRKQLEKCAEDLINGGSSNCSSSGGVHNVSGSIVSAHLLMGTQPSPNSTASMQPIKNWVHHNITTHLDGVRVTSHRLQVPSSGLYYLYSQVGFELYYDTNVPVESRTQDLYHYVKRYNPVYPNGGNQVLLKSSNTQCWEQRKNFGHYTSYVGAGLKLNRGDQIYVEVSSLSLSMDPYNSYFGLFKIA